MADFEELTKKAKDTIKNLVGKEPLSVTRLNKEGNGWLAQVEVLERKAIPDTQNIIGIYEVKFNNDKTLSGYKRIKVKRKGDTGEEEHKEDE
ncbi:MAG: gas vesicle protein [Nanoarchaeota archaeon]|nr:gas vesicle protein [Nanoarchaeota archaeon]